MSELTCTFCGTSLNGSGSRCRGCGGSISSADFPVDDSGATTHEIVHPEIELAMLAVNAGPLPADKRARNGGLFARIESLRADMRHRLEVIDTLAARGVPQREIYGCQSDDEVTMDAAVCALRVLNQRHASAMLELQQAPTDADAADPVSALAADIYEALRQNGYQTFDDLAAHFGTNVPRVVLAVKQLELASEKSGARIIRYLVGAEIDETAQPGPAAERIPIRATNAIAGIPVRQVPGQRGFYGVLRPKLRTGTFAPDAAAGRLAELGVPAAGRAV